MQAFEGLRVLDLTHVLAGPFSTYQLAVLGADVIKIEGPGAVDMNREIGAVGAFNAALMGTHFQSQAANKRAITLNLKSEQGRAIFKDLAKTADVIVENFRAGKLDALGLGYEDIRAIKPDIIYCSMTGFGQTGPKREHAAFDNTIQAYSG
ncbi:MAG: CoA transferase, partial [Pseudomonadota bacterium]